MLSLALRTGLAAQAYAQIRASLLEGEFAPGDAVSENQLTERFGMSRTPIREALQALAAEGLLETVPARGWFVPRRSVSDLHEMFELREALEGMAARGAAQRATEAENVALTALCDAYERADDWREWAAKGTEFHTRIALAARNARLSAALDQLKAQIVLARRSELRASRGRGDEAAREHRAILAAIAARDADAAERHARAHVRRSHEASFQDRATR